MAVRIVDTVAVALLVLCGFSSALNNMDLAQLLRDRQKIAQQKRAMDGTWAKKGQGLHEERTLVTQFAKIKKI